jgi:HSP20 family molecular chaperone IbpA
MATMLMTRRDPFAEFDAVIRRAFPARSGFATSAFTPAAEVLRDGDDAVVRLELPGLDLDKDVTVELDRGHLVVRGERLDKHSDERTDGNGTVRYLREMRYGSFRRSFTLPEHVTAEALSASYDAGVLSVRVAGAYAGTEPRKIVVTAGTPAASTVPGTDEVTVDAGQDASQN